MRAADRALDAAVNWLAYHPRWTTAIICMTCIGAGWLEKILP